MDCSRVARTAETELRLPKKVMQVINGKCGAFRFYWLQGRGDKGSSSLCLLFLDHLKTEEKVESDNHGGFLSIFSCERTRDLGR